MDKATFRGILSRQQESGLSIKSFCENEIYPVSSFHYWKGKYGLTTPHTRQMQDVPPELLAPVSFGSSIRSASSALPVPAIQKDEISIELSSGLRVRFRGKASMQAAMKIITQLCCSHVLP